MNPTDAMARLGIPATTRQDEVNPLRLAINHEFDRKNPPKHDGDYRKRAIDRCIRTRTWFRSEANTAFDFLERFVRVVCPVCSSLMQPEGTMSGAGDRYSATYACGKKCCTFSLSVSSDAMAFHFPEDTLNLNSALAALFDTAVESLGEYYPVLQSPSYVTVIRDQIKWPDFGAGEKEYLDIKGQVEKAAQELSPVEGD